MIQLYHYPYSQHARRVVSLLEQEGIAYALEHVAMDQGAHMAPDYLAINPNHKVPTLVDGDVKIHESNAILRYLCQKHALEGWYPTDLAKRAPVEEWLDWNQCRLSPAVVDVVFNKAFAGDAADHNAIARGEKALVELVAILDDRLEASPFVAGDEPTIADLSIASNIFHLGFADAQPSAKHVKAWYARVEALPGFQRSLPKG